MKLCKKRIYHLELKKLRGIKITGFQNGHTHELPKNEVCGRIHRQMEKKSLKLLKSEGVSNRKSIRMTRICR